jgi:hypothetical protein
MDVRQSQDRSWKRQLIVLVAFRSSWGSDVQWELEL